jgi:trehalose 6-phosphate phosphatase
VTVRHPALSRVIALGRRLARHVPPPPLSPHCALFLDIDGTLVELAERPDAARPDRTVHELLPALTDALDGAFALVTGRSISDVDRMFPGVSVPVAGQHGAERRDAHGTVHLHAPEPETLAGLRSIFTAFAGKHPGLLLEDKGHSLAIHYRQAPGLAALVRRTVVEGVEATGTTGYELQPGKCLLELRPEGRDKGAAIRDFMGEPPFRDRFPVFVGDDRGDEHGFATVDELGGWSVKVGGGRSRARFRLDDVTAVRRWLGGPLAGRTSFAEASHR